MAHRDVVTRFAPSPTGYLHIGGARTALFNWAFARHHGGTFILRLEDTDAVRSSTEAARAIIEDMHWLGMHWDEGPPPEGEDPFAQPIGSFGPYCQSQRLDIYNEMCERLLKSGAAFEENGAVRFRMPRRDITVHDLVLGEVTTPADKIEDLIIRKSDGFPTFHFANVIDDATMAVTHVIRAQEHLNNTHKHLALFEALDLKPPKYAHIPLIFNPDGSKMSKRDKAKAARAAAQKSGLGHLDDTSLDFRAFMARDTDDVRIAEAVARQLNVPLPEIDVRDFRASGYLPEVLCNYIALLGWNPGGDVEKFDNEYLVQHFSLERVGKANAKFDREKLASFSADALKAMPIEQFTAALRQQIDAAGGDAKPQAAWDDQRWTLFAEAYRERARTLSDPLIAGRFFFIADDQVEYDAAAVDKVLAKNNGEGYAALADFRRVLDRVEPWSPQEIEAAVKQFAEHRGVGMGKVAQPIRVAVSGGTVSPPLGLTLTILGRAATLRRIDRTLSLRGGQ